MDEIPQLTQIEFQMDFIPEIKAHPIPEASDTPVQNLLEEEIPEDFLAGFQLGEVNYMDDLSSVSDTKEEEDEEKVKVNRPNKRRREKIKNKWWTTIYQIKRAVDRTDVYGKVMSLTKKF